MIDLSPLNVMAPDFSPDPAVLYAQSYSSGLAYSAAQPPPQPQPYYDMATQYADYPPQPLSTVRPPPRFSQLS